MDRILGYSDWEGMVCRTMERPDGNMYAEGFNPKTFNWDIKVSPASLMFSGSLTGEEVEARLAEIKSAAESS